MDIEKTVKNVRTKMVLVTPRKATKWLGKNTNNRLLRDTAVSRLASDMKAGRWMLTHQGIAFNCDGTLLDGQHRLAAIVKSGTQQWMPITVGLPRESVAAIDDHQKRSVGDSLAIVHGIRLPNVARATAAAVWVHAGWKGDANMRVLSRQERIEIFQRHQEAIEWAIATYPTNTTGLGRSAVLAVIARAYYSGKRTDVARFCSILMDSSKASRAADSCVLKLRDWLMVSPSGGWASQLETYRKTSRVLAAFLAGEKLTKIYEASEEMFPTPEEKSRKK